MMNKRRIQSGAERVSVMMDQAMKTIYDHMQETFPEMTKEEIDAILKEVLISDELLRRRIIKEMPLQ